MKHNKYLILIGGPTAVGKTSTAIALAKRLKCEIISADSRQFYREMDIGTAKPTKQELSQVKHHFIDSLSIHDTYSVGDFESDAMSLLENIFMTQDYSIVVGGSGLFLNAICYGLDKFPTIDPAIREKLNDELVKNGLATLALELENKDPNYYEQVDQDNPQRVIRALEVIRGTSKTFSSFLQKKSIERPFKTILFQLQMERSILYDRINQRVVYMVEQGLEAEARALHPLKELNALRTVGYSEWFDHFDGLISTAKAIELIQRNTRRYAKRQTTWFKNQGNYLPILQGETAVDEMIKHIEEYVNK